MTDGEHISKRDIEDFCIKNGWKSWYNDNYWIKDNEYAGKTLCELYCRLKYPDLSNKELFPLVMNLEYRLNEDKNLYIHGKTFHLKDELKKRFNAKWDVDKKCWYVNAKEIMNEQLHEFCYSQHNPLNFSWN